jgi:hypothetical protein
MNSAAKGRKNEHRSRDILIAAGYWVNRSAASKGPFDLIGIRPDGVVLVQVKSGRWPSPEERAELRAIPCPPNVRKEMHRWDRYARLPDIRPL